MERRGESRRPIEPELFALLEGIRQTGKLTTATAQVGLPYRQAWGLIAKWSGVIGQPLVEKEQGRGTKLTPLGERLLWLRERIETCLSLHLESAASEMEQQLSGMLNGPSPMISLYASHDLVLAELRDFVARPAGTKARRAVCRQRRQRRGAVQGPLRDARIPRAGGRFRQRTRRRLPTLAKAAATAVDPIRQAAPRADGAGGQPEAVRSVGDIVRTQARFINRQRGSGTRLAVEKMLKDQGVDRGDIVGFYSEEFTHMAVAVASGMADVAIGIEATAVKLGLEFIPMFTEDYYLLAKRESLEQENMPSWSRSWPARRSARSPGA